MRFTNIRELKHQTNRVLALGKKNGPVVVMRRSRPVALLRIISEKDFALKIAPLWNRLKDAAERAGYGPEDVEKLIRRSRAPKR